MAISDLDQSTPSDSASAGGGAGELRGIKAALNECFGGVDGPVLAGTGEDPATAADLIGLFDRMAAVEAAVAGVFVQGMTVFWPYSVASIPTGWAQATGATVNGFTTRDMRGRFPLGADSVYVQPGDAGGSIAAITSSSSGSVSAGTTGNTSLSLAQLPSALSGAIRVKVAPGENNMNHLTTSIVAGAAGSGSDQTAPMSVTGASDSPHNHTVPAIPAHTHTVTPTAPPYVGGCWITYVGVAA